MDETDAVSRAAVQLADAIEVSAIVTISASGMTPRLVSRYRPDDPIICATWLQSTLRQMSVVWGVQSALVSHPSGTDDAMSTALREFVTYELLHEGDKVVITAGLPAQEPGNTNLVHVRKV